MKRKDFSILAHVLLGAIFLTSCTTAVTPTSPTAESALPASSTATQPASKSTATSAQGATGTPIEIRWLYRIVDASSDQLAKWIVDTFNEEYGGNIHVTAYGVDDETYRTKLSIELRGSNPPDVFFNWEGGQAKDVVDKGFAASLDDYYIKYGWDKELIPAAVNLATFDGHEYFVATEMQASVVWYRPDIFAKYNLQVPKTWDELTTIADTLKENGVAPFMLANQSRWEAQFDWSAIYVNTYGVRAYDDLINNKIPWTDQKVADTFAKVKWMVDNGWYVKNPNSRDNADAVIPFCNGEAAMWYQGTFLLPSLHGGKGTDFLCPVDFFTYPQIGGQEPTASVYANETLMVNANSKKKDAAAEFVNFVVSKEAQQHKVGVRPFASNASVDYSNVSSIEQKVVALMTGAHGYTFMHPDHALSSSIADPFLDALQGVIGGIKTPEEAAADTEKAAIAFRGPVK